ncbi:methylmalonyl-CoA mutase [Corynebacterium hindlerae]|uniref:methylmalonyl-CoA mutase family protein n=1 Tax=Corynebacterium hindlerae TaxID=699041 RepID=UPI001AD674A9|nr:methylmalonyl-CoA mutase family protein [Corynebacterium hindlerae]QTH58791.1 methylmalonyl-CoA mutase [Corynebacterium hindlerae]
MTDVQSDAVNTSLPADFAETQQDWYKAVAKVFARVQKKDIADVPLDVWTRLIHTTYEGIDVNPLYTRADELAEVSAPGVFPFTRGDVTPSGWGVTETFGGLASGTAGDAAATNKAILHALNNGSTVVVIDLTAGLTAADLPTVLKDVYLDLVEVRVLAGANIKAASDALKALAEEAGVAEKARFELSAAPLTAGFVGTESIALADAVALAVENVAFAGSIRTMLVDAVTFNNQGATDAQEIGFALATGVEYVRALTAAGLSIEDALGQIAFRFAASDDQFAQIAKFRAARTLWARVAEVLGAPEAGLAPQHALTAPAMFSQRDPWVNMLRVTVAAFAAGVGGADDVEVLPFDHSIPGGLPGTSRVFAARIARNTNLLLLEESHLGHVIDPAGGSYFVESLTQQLADKAWGEFTEVEGKGGLQAAADAVQDKLDASYERVRADIARRVKKVTGINEFPNLGEKPLPAELRVEPAGVRRWAAEFEALRNRSDAFLEANGKRPLIGMIPIGPLAKHNVRTGFTANLLASGGIETLNPGQLVAGTDEFAAAAKETDIVVVCGTDQEYAATGADVVKALREAGAGTILVAGAEKSFADAEVKPDGYVNMKIDAAQVLAELLTKLGA